VYSSKAQQADIAGPTVSATPASPAHPQAELLQRLPNAHATPGTRLPNAEATPDAGLPSMQVAADAGPPSHQPHPQTVASIHAAAAAAVARVYTETKTMPALQVRHSTRQGCMVQ
jgi:hypothetical protein